MAMFYALEDIRHELGSDGGGGAVTGQPRGDKRAGF